ncbi:nuclear pore protein 84/107 [Abortiporus biennis]|nr:nuclear pore protein 84/107 [Abortiporus biennis]
MSDALYAACADVLSLAQSRKDDLAALLDPVEGFAPKLRQICEDQMRDFQDNPNSTLTPEELSALQMESDTWGLLQAIMPLRKTTPPAYPSPQSLIQKNPYTPISTLAQAIMHSSTLLSELVVVREWLHETAPLPDTIGDSFGPGATTGYWKFTKHQVVQNLRIGSNGKGKEREGGLVTELDPDAVNRGEGGGLDAEDANYEKALINALYLYVRAGRLDEAVELCRKAQQPWRAASIRGSLLFRWKEIADEPREDDATEDDDEKLGWRGNLHRRLWKTTCIQAALNPHLSTAERALYAAIAPTPQTSTQLKAACRTWPDHLWAQISIMCEEKESAELAKLKGGFWEDDSKAISSSRAANGGQEEWEREVLNALESLRSIPVEEGAPANNPYHISQLQIILDRLDELLEAFAVGLQTGSYDPTQPDYPTMTRFMAHLCLFLQMIDVSAPPLAIQVILEAYLQVLERAGQRELIAMYAGALGDNAVERYAMFLTSLELTADIHERKLALTRARDHGLDMELVAVATAERTIGKTFEKLGPAKGPLPSLVEPQPEPSNLEWLLVRSIEWTTFMESTYSTALEQANVILRYFLACGRLQLAKRLLEILPPELLTIRDSEELAMEYMHYRQFFTVWDSLDRIGECLKMESPGMSKDTKAAWLNDYKTLISQAREQVIKLLTTEWLIPDMDRNGADQRTRQLVRIRQIYIPVLIIRLHEILYDSRRKLPENLKHALMLANIVADSRYRLYDDFVPEDGRRLGDYLVHVREAILGGLEGGGSDPFRVLLV